MRQAERKTSSRPPTTSSGGGATTLVRVIGITGRVLVALGLLLLFYTVYLLWGTSVYTKQAQNDLARQLEAAPLLAREAVSRDGDIQPARPPSEPPLGAPLFTISIPRIALRTVVVQGVGREELKKGPGRFPDCAATPGAECVEGSPWPGEPGNVALSGHRTTFGAPFFNLNELQPGDVIDIESGPARYRYRVREQDGGIGHRIVPPSAIEVVEDHGVPELTLTTCHPRFSAAQRLIIHADYEGASFIAPPDGGGGGRGGDLVDVAGGEPTLVPESPPAVPTDVLILAAIAIAALIGAMALSERLRGAAVWTTVVVVGSAGLWIAVFPQILRLMPANY